jgi:hypothetical protein
MSLGLNLKRFSESHGPAKTREFLAEAISTGKINPRRDVRIRELAESFMGPNWRTHLTRFNEGKGRLAESSVDASSFVDITGQLLVNEIKDKYNTTETVVDELFETIPVTNGNLGPQKTPYLSDVKDDPEYVQPGKEYPNTTFSAQYITYPGPRKQGQICQVTMEAIYSDLTGQILDSAGSVSASG